jgi:tetratricopeptide (TPR) repeat protein
MVVIKIFVHRDVPINIIYFIDIIIINSNKTQLMSTLYAAAAFYRSLVPCFLLCSAIGPKISFGSPLSPNEIADLQRKTSETTIAGLNAAIRLDPKSAGLLVLRAGAYWDKHNYDAAIGDLDAAIGLNPNSASLFVARGNNYRAKQDYDHAIADNTEAIRLDPKYALAFDNRGRAFAAKQDYDRAIADYSEAIRLNPK